MHYQCDGFYYIAPRICLNSSLYLSALYTLNIKNGLGRRRHMMGGSTVSTVSSWYLCPLLECSYAALERFFFSVIQ